jgi:hypothetical protein
MRSVVQASLLCLLVRLMWITSLSQVAAAVVTRPVGTSQVVVAAQVA